MVIGVNNLPDYRILHILFKRDLSMWAMMCNETQRSHASFDGYDIDKFDTKLRMINKSHRPIDVPFYYDIMATSLNDVGIVYAVLEYVKDRSQIIPIEPIAHLFGRSRLIWGFSSKCECDAIQLIFCPNITPSHDGRLQSVRKICHLSAVFKLVAFITDLLVRVQFWEKKRLFPKERDG